MAHLLEAAAVGFAVGLACPGVIRAVRSAIFGEAAKVEADVKKVGSKL